MNSPKRITTFLLLLLPLCFVGSASAQEAGTYDDLLDLFSAAGAPLPDEGVQVLNMREQSAEDVCTALLGAPCAREASE